MSSIPDQHEQLRTSSTDSPNVTPAQTWGHQPPAIEFLASRQASLLEAHMGTGKTFMAMSSLCRILAKSQTALILCPRAVIGGWLGEQRKHAAFASLRVIVPPKTGNAEKRSKAMAEELANARMHQQTSILVLNYESAILPAFKALLLSIPLRAVVCDESQRIKGHGSQISKFVASLAERTLNTVRICLSGTPIDNDPGDLFAQFRFLDPTVFGRFWTHYRSQYAIMNPYIPNAVKSWKNIDEIKRKIAPYRHHIPKGVLVLPDKQMIRVSCDLTKGKDAYFKMQRDGMIEIKKAIESGEGITEERMFAVGQTGAVNWMRLLQLAQGYVRTEDGEEVDTDTEKRRVLLDLLEQTDEPVCVYGWFTHDMATVKRCCEILGRRYGEVSGQRNDLTQYSKYPEDVDVLAVQIKSGGSGVDLTRSRIGIILNTGLVTPGGYDQMMARQYRPGQTQNVTYYYLVTEGTVDAAVYDARDKKQGVIDSILKLDDFEF